MPTVSVIIPCARGPEQIIRMSKDFALQTYRDIEVVMVYDGVPSQRVLDAVGQLPQFFRFDRIEKSSDKQTGTTPRNVGTGLATGEYVVYCDDDDRYKSTYLAALMSATVGNAITVVQMACQESRIRRGGSPHRILCIPEPDLPHFPMICHVGTPCFIVKREWALEEPWRDEPEHDFHFIRRIVDRYRPAVTLREGMEVDVDGMVMGDGDWL